MADREGRVVDGADSTAARQLRRAAPALDGPLASSGAAPEPATTKPSTTKPSTAKPTVSAQRTGTPSGTGPTGSAGPTDDRRTADDKVASGSDDRPADGGTSDGASGVNGAVDEKVADKAADVDTVKAGTDVKADGASTKTGPETAATSPATKTAGDSETADVPKPATEPKPAGDSKTASDTKTASDSGKSGAEPGGTASGGTTGAGPDAPVSEEPTPTGRRRRIRVPFGRAARRVPPARQLPAVTARAVRTWSIGGSGRLVLPAMFILVLVAAAGLAGGVLIPATANNPPSRTGAAGLDSDLGGPNAPGPGGSVAPTGGASLPATGLPGVGLPGTGQPGAGPAPTARPADVLTGWAQQAATRTGVSPMAMQAYGYAELVLAQTMPACKLTWTTLAAIGYVESRHGTANGATLDAKGASTPRIIGDPLDGNGGRMRIMDTDGGQLDGDSTYDRAVGPMQFIPTTWQENGVDADNDGVKNPQDLDDAALAAGNYLCKGSRNLSVAEDWWNAILSYNDVRVYAQDVFNKANEYGANSRA